MEPNKASISLSWFNLAQSKWTEGRSKKRAEKDYKDESDEEDESFISFGPSSQLQSVFRPSSRTSSVMSDARRSALDSTWKTVESTFHAVVSRANAKLFKQLIAFLDEHEEPMDIEESEKDDIIVSSNADSDNESNCGAGKSDKVEEDKANQNLGMKRNRSTRQSSPVIQTRPSSRNQTLERLKRKYSSSTTSESESDYDNDDLSSHHMEDDDDHIGPMVEEDTDLEEAGVVYKAHEEQQSDDLEDYDSSLVQSSSSHSFMPFLSTALVIGGQDSTDNEMLFSSLADTLRASSNRRVVQLNSSASSSHRGIVSAKSILYSLAAAIPKRKVFKAIESPLEKIIGWCSSSNANRSLVVLVGECEQYGGDNLRTLVQLLSFLRRKSANISLILGMSCVNGQQGLHSLLERDDLSKLEVVRFTPIDSVLIFEDLFMELFVRSKVQLRFSRAVLEWLHDNFRLNDLSLNEFLRHLKYSVMEHFSSEPLSFLCITPSKKTVSSGRTIEEWANTVMQRYSAEISECLHLPRVKKPKQRKGKPIVVPGTFPSPISYGLEREDDEDDAQQEVDTETSLQMKLVELEQNRREVPLIFEFVRACGLKLGFLTKTEALARVFFTSETEDYIVNMKKSILRASDEEIESIKNMALDFLPQNFHVQVNMAWRIEREVAIRHQQEEIATSSATINRKRTRLHYPEDFHKWAPAKRRQWEFANRTNSTTNEVTLQQHNSSSTAISNTSLVSCKTRVLGFLQDLIQNHLFIFLKGGPSPQSLDGQQWRRAVVFNRVGSLKRVFSLNQVQIVSKALSFPNSYLACTCCSEDRTEEEYPHANMDDICIAFKLLKYEGDPFQVNLKQWYEAFVDILNSGVAANKKRVDRKLMLGRFVRAACELQYLGFWKGDYSENARKLMDISS